MPSIPNGRLLFNEIPTGFPEPGKTLVYNRSKMIDLETEPLNGGVLIKTLALSADPSARVLMRPKVEDGFVPSYRLGEPIYCLGMGRVLRSEKEGFKVGDYVYGAIDAMEYSVPKINFPALSIRVIRPEPGLDHLAYLGAGGLPGQTAYYGWKEYTNAKAGETIFVSGGAGPVGSFVIQLAKQDGLKVIASAGTDEKVQFCKDVGADVAFNYKTTNVDSLLKKEGPLNLYWDNVGGTMLDVAIGHAAFKARFVECGAMSEYNTKEGVMMRNLDQIYARCISLHGFLVMGLATKWQAEFYKVIPKMLASGRIRYKQDVTRGLENGGDAIREVQIGKNEGKKIIVVADE